MGCGMLMERKTAATVMAEWRGMASTYYHAVHLRMYSLQQPLLHLPMKSCKQTSGLSLLHARCRFDRCCDMIVTCWCVLDRN